MSKNKIGHKPKLYINQPFTQFPDIIMQDKYYISPEKDAKKEHDLQPPQQTEIEFSESDISPNPEPPQEHNTKEMKVEEIPIMNANHPGDHQSPEKDSNPFSTKRKHSYSFRRVKNFKEMTIDEKLDYLNDYPEQLSPVSCLYLTKETTYVGILSRTPGDEVVIILPDNTQVTLRKSDLKEIRMLGLR